MEHLISFIRPLYLCGQHDIRVLPRYVFLPCRIEECEDCRRTGYRRNFRVGGYASGQLFIADQGAGCQRNH